MMNYLSPSSRTRAFTLIEAIIAMVVIGVTMPAMLWALGQANLDRVSPIQASTAKWLAMEKLEDVIADRSDPSRGYGYIISSNYPNEAKIPNFPGYTRQVTIVETDALFTAGGVGVKTIAVTVKWAHGNGQPHTISLRTVVTDLTP